MDKSFWSDLVSLAKAGYKPSDVKELLALGSTEPAEDQNKDNPDNSHKEEVDKKPPEKETKSAFEKLAES